MVIEGSILIWCKTDINKGGSMKGKIIKWVAIVGCLAVIATLPWLLNACGSSGSDAGGGSSTTHTMTLKGGLT